jgi:hypothetical protein
VKSQGADPIPKPLRVKSTRIRYPWGEPRTRRTIKVERDPHDSVIREVR